MFFWTSTRGPARSTRFRQRVFSRSSSVIRLSRGSDTRGTGPRFYTVPAQRDITLKDLLTHVSGLGSGETQLSAQTYGVAHAAKIPSGRNVEFGGSQGDANRCG